MAFDPQRQAQAIAQQRAAANDGAPQVRLIAGPGTGKSFSIEYRVEHLLRVPVDPEKILAVSFTRNSAADLRHRIRKHCTNVGLPQGSDVPVSTLHSVALKVMRLANLLTTHPVDPRVLDGWEMSEWIDREFSKYANVTPGRAKAIREFHEAWWSTGLQNPANYIPAVPPVTAPEQASFVAFHGMQAGFYACLLVGEIVRACMTHASPGLIQPRALLGVDHLVVDEYQDLNPMDLDFVDHLVGAGVTTFVAGDDDQSVYSFRHASPAGIQTFRQRHQTSTTHHLSDCFRCTPALIGAAQTLLGAFSPPQRIAKQLTSLYASANPPLQGHAALWRYNSPQAEAEAIADSCLTLRAAGLNLGDIMILLGNARVTAKAIQDALDTKGVPNSPVRTQPFRDTRAGRSAFSLLRVLSDATDLVAYRTLLALLPGMGPTRCLDITQRCLQANLSAVDLFTGHIAAGVLTAMQDTKVQEVRALVGAMQGWIGTDTLAKRGTDLGDLVEQVCGAPDRHEWDAFTATLPPDTMLAEIRDLLYADDLDEEYAVIHEVHGRLGLGPPPETDPDRVQVMTMHGSKGLSAKVAFIPGLEENVFPNQRRSAALGLVQEGARLLYVSLTRARAAAFCSYTSGRVQNGAFVQNPPSRYLAHLGIPMVHRTTGLTQQEAQQVAATSAGL